MNAFPLCDDWGGERLWQNKQAIARCLLGRAMPIPVPRKESSGSGKRDERFRVAGREAPCSRMQEQRLGKRGNSPRSWISPDVTTSERDG
jgi:hypothetical protein